QRSPLDAELVQRAHESKAVHDHADRSHQASLVDVDLVGGDRDVVGARSADFLHHGVNGRVGVLATQAANLIVDLACLHGTAAGAVDLEHNALRSLVLERGLQACNQVVGAGAAGSVDLTLDFDHCRALVEAEPLAARPRAKRREKDDEQKSKREQLEKNSPTARATLLAQAIGRQSLEDAALP